LKTDDQTAGVAAMLLHHAFLYDSDDQFATQMSRFLADALDDGAAAVAVTSRANWSLLHDALGERASNIHFTDRDDFYVRPSKALAQYDATLRHHLSKGAQSVRVVAEVQFGPTQAEWHEWTAYEAIANHAFAERPAWIVCPYDERTLPAPVIEDAWRTHPSVMTADRQPSPLYGEVEALVRSLAPQHEALPGLEPLRDVPDAQTFRDLLADRLTAAAVQGSRKLDMLVAATEVFANGSSHGGGVTLVRIGTVDGRFVCEITDAGVGLDDPFAGYLPPQSEDVPGAGLWVARQLCWRVDLLSSPLGLSVRLWL
jgi:anti-sigma regulatory factor (Ser/Thr protein kinase)